ncbi:MAG TPA: CHAT domain-containing tetratricopeptide repeat protein [Stenomitos sp.]
MSIKVDAREIGAVMADEVVMQMEGNSIGKKSRSLLLDLVSLLTQKPNPPAPSGAREGGAGALPPSPRSRSFSEEGVGGEVFGLALLIAVVLVSESVAAAPKQFSPRFDPPPVRVKKGEAKSWGELSSFAQQPAATEQDANRAAAEQAYQEGKQLFKQGTAESLQQAIAKFEEALSLSRAVGDKAGEAVILLGIGQAYSDLGQKQTALEYYNQSLQLIRIVGEKGWEALILTGIGLKTTQTLINSPLQRTLAMSQGFKPLADANPYTPLLVNHEIVSLPSASTIAVLRNELKDRKPAPKTLVALADPVFEPNDPRLKTSQPQQNPPSSSTEATRSAIEIGVNLQRLEYTRKEAESILALVPENQRFSAFDFAASRTTATKPDLSQYRIIHLATHGLLNTINPELSGVVLSLLDENGADTNGFLRLNDIFNLNLPAELVVLSACETGLGKDVKGEGLVGLTRGFMYAGAKRVTVSLWSVNDTATSTLMTKYYQKMLNEGLNPVAALRAAQLEMIKTEQWKAPYYWAAFVVQGEWR